MIFNLEPLDGLPALPKAACEPFHKSCRIIDARAIRRRVALLLARGQQADAEDLMRAFARTIIASLSD